MQNRIKPRRLFRKLRGNGVIPDEPRYIEATNGEIVDNLEDAEVISSESADSDIEPLQMHYPVIDIDFLCYVIPTNGSHKYTLFIDQPVTGDAYFKMLDAMADAGVVERGYAQVSRKRGYSAARLPWVNKRSESG